MNRDIEFRPTAIVEFNQSADWYEARQIGLGSKYVGAIDVAIESIIEAPTRYAIVYKKIRVISVKGFPYHVYYRILENDVIEVISVFHIRQNPEIWQSRQ